MGIVVSFSNYVPQPRYDGVAWTIIKIQESTSSGGTYALIDTIQISTLPGGVDLNPEEPKPRSFTTDNGTVPAGWYKVVFENPTGDQAISNPIQNVAPPEEPWWPSVRDVALKILSRTKDKYGNQLGTFTADTLPQVTDVIGIIGQAALYVADVIGDDIPVAFYDDAANVVALRAAMQIELAYYSDQVNTGRSIYPQLDEEYKLCLENLKTQISSGGADPSTLTSMKPSYSFPDAGIGYKTVW